MKYCDDCKWCSCNFKPTEGEARQYGRPIIEKKDSRFYTCMHPESSKGARFNCELCTIMRLEHRGCKKEALLFEEK